MGHIVVATVALREPEDQAAVTARVRAYARERLDRYKIPMLVDLVDEAAYTERFKKIRPR